MRPVSQGFTLVELLVVITIIGILVSLLLPAVQAAREAGRRAQCQNNIKQAGLAVVNYENQFKVFPPSSCWGPLGSDGKPNPTDGGPGCSGDHYRASWVVLVLPFMDMQVLHDTFDLNRYISGNCAQVGTQPARSSGDVDNKRARGTKIPGMLCPSDPYNTKPFDGNGDGGTNSYTKIVQGSAGTLGLWARGNYAANASLAEMRTDDTTENAPFYAGATSASPGWKCRWLRGVMGANTVMTAGEITDGLSNTILLGEVRAGVTQSDSRGVWALPLGGSSSLWAHGGIYGDDYGPNAPYADAGADDVMGGSEIAKAFGGCSALGEEGMSCGNTGGTACTGNGQATMRSRHPGGVNSCFCDGSVHWIGDYIDVKSSTYKISNKLITTATLSVWDCLNCSTDGQVFSGKAY